MNTQKPSKSRVLLVDDDQSVRNALGDLLESEGFEVIRAENGHEALLKFAEHHADLAVLDLTMPVKGGLETSAWLRSIAPKLPIVSITARPDAHRLVISTGAVLMPKPLHIPLLLRVIRDLLTASSIHHRADGTSHRSSLPSPEQSFRRRSSSSFGR